MIARRLAPVALALALASCGPPPKVQFGGPLAKHAPEDYDKVRERWTRHVHKTIPSELDTAIDADITLMSPDFRGAYIARVADMRQLTTAQRDQLVKDQTDDAEKYVDLIINMQTARWEWNDLTAPRSVWTITLVDDKGHESGSPEIIQTPVKPEVLGALFGTNLNHGSAGNAFNRSYRVRYPRNPPELLGPETRKVTLRIAGPLGVAEALWEAP